LGYQLWKLNSEHSHRKKYNRDLYNVENTLKRSQQLSFYIHSPALGVRKAPFLCQYWQYPRKYSKELDRAIGQAISRWLPTTAARVLLKVRPCGICEGQSDIGTGFLPSASGSFQILIPPTTP
jgi:hypothetical protein